MKRFLLIALLSLPAVMAFIPESRAAGDGDDLAAVLKSVGGWESYAFRVEENLGPGTGGPMEVRFQKGKPLFCKADRIEFFKNGDAVAYREGDRWLRSKTGTTSDPLRVLGSVAKVRAVRLPHEELATLGKTIGTVKKGKDGDQTVYTVELSAEVARSQARPEHRGVAQGGSARFWVEGSRLVKYTVTIKLQGRIGDADVDGAAVKTVSVNGVGTTEVAVPEAARKALE